MIFVVIFQSLVLAFMEEGGKEIKSKGDRKECL